MWGGCVWITTRAVRKIETPRGTRSSAAHGTKTHPSVTRPRLRRRGEGGLPSPSSAQKVSIALVPSVPAGHAHEKL